MARLVAVCRDGEEDFPFLARQIPLYIDDTLTMVMEFSDSVLTLDSRHTQTPRWKLFAQHHAKLKQQDLNTAMMVTSREVFSTLAQLVPCVGCRRSVERLFSMLVESGAPALEPLLVRTTATLSVTEACLADAKKLYSLFYVHGSKLNDMIDAIPKSKKNKRCQVHSLDTHKPKPLGGSWMDVWELMSQECRDEVVLIDSACLLETLEMYLHKHRFCSDCKNKVLRAYDILVGELECTKEPGYCAALYEGLCCCPHERHVHVCCETDFIAHLLGRAEPEFSGVYEERERHAKTMDVAQEEVLTCLGIHLYGRLHRIWQKLRAEEQTWQMLFYLGVDGLRKSFEMAVEKMQGISRLEQFNKCGLDVSELEAKEKTLDECSLESVDVGCKVCLSPHSHGSDCGYSSSMEGSETGSRGGSDVACTEEVFNHEEAGDKGEEEGVDSCLECWANAEEIAKGKNKKKKRKGKSLCNNQGHKAKDCAAGENPPGHGVTASSHNQNRQTKEARSPARGRGFASIALGLPGPPGAPGPPNGTKSLAELLGDADFASDNESRLTPEEIRAFLESNKSFYRRRDQYRQRLRDSFTDYCRATQPGETLRAESG
ncbi:hypothetical protein NHX12_009653 [Muraenolepis orangiensis]|uniref:Gametogenetin-binding protein 2 n=1 Tax=Muraenolepis orangiensis TaxID=630683 RepID=A0A9Q0DGU0_9TELE|nr:hypothetical protein NHX12_009653 [Muraenolepis orangiensis]